MSAELRSPDRPVLLSVTGTDGAGKSSITRSLSQQLAVSGLTVLRNDRWDVLTDRQRHPSARFVDQDVVLARQCLTEMPARSRLLMLLWTMDLSLEAAVLEPADVVLLDSYWMKHAAVEVVYGLDPGWVRGVCEGLRPVDATAYLRVHPEQAWERLQGHVNAYECGLDPSLSRASFLRHQHAVRDVLDAWAQELSWHVVDADENPADVTASALRYLQHSVDERPRTSRVTG